jgi:hypothetical protein
MKRATRTTRLITQTPRKSVGGAFTALSCTRRNGMLHCYIPSEIAKINRQPSRLECIVSSRKQTPAAPINRNLSRTLQNRFRRANSSHSSLATSHCLFHPQTLLAGHRSRVTIQESQFTNHARRPSRRTCQVAKKQQIRRSRLNPLGLYFLASYAHFAIGRQRALVHNGGNKVAAGYNDKNRTALVGLEPSREHQSITR